MSLKTFSEVIVNIKVRDKLPLGGISAVAFAEAALAAKGLATVV